MNPLIRLFILSILSISLILSPSMAADACQEEEDAGNNCTVITPVLTCDSFTYDLINESHVVTNDGPLTSEAQAGVYSTTFNRSFLGWHQFILCDNSTAQITVKRTKHDKLDSIEANLSDFNSTVNTDLSEIDTLINALNDIAAADVWTVASRTLTAFDWGIVSNTEAFKQNVSNGTWDETYIAQKGRLVNTTNNPAGTATVDEEAIARAAWDDTVVPQFNRTINATGITASTNNTAIAFEVFDTLMQNRTEVFHNDSSNFPLNETWEFDDGSILYRVFDYWPDNITIRNATNTLDTGGR